MTPRSTSKRGIDSVRADSMPPPAPHTAPVSAGDQNKRQKVVRKSVDVMMNTLKRAVQLRKGVLFTALRGVEDKDFVTAIRAGLPPIESGWRKQLARINSEKRFDLVLRILIEAYVAALIGERLLQSERLAFLRKLDNYYVVALELSKFKKTATSTTTDDAQAAKKISNLASDIAMDVISLGLARLCTQDEAERAAFKNLQELLIRCSMEAVSGKLHEEGVAQKIENTRVLLALVFLDDRCEQKLHGNCLHSLKQATLQIMDVRALAEINSTENCAKE